MRKSARAIGVALAAVLTLVLASGCATVVSSGTNAVNVLELEAARSDGKPFFLLDGSRQPVSRAIGRGGRIRFDLPTDRFVGQCVSVHDETGKPVLGDRKTVFLAVRADYQDAWRQRQGILSQSTADASADKAARGQLESLTSRLRTNRAFVDGACTRPAQQPLPPRPLARCASEDECRRDGSLICHTRYLGAKGCGYAANQLKISGLVSSPGCAALAANLAGQKYDLGDAFVDFLHGVAGEAARQLWKSDSLSDNAWAIALAIGSEVLQLNEARTCTNDFVERQFAPLRNWSTRAAQIEAEPQQLLGSCQRDLTSATEQARHAALAASTAADSKARADAIEARLTQLGQERRGIEWCKG